MTAPAPAPAPASTPGKALGIVGLILAIVWPFQVLGLILSIIGRVQSKNAGAKNGRRRVPVKLGVGNGTRIQVVDGLKEGDRVVLPS